MSEEKKRKRTTTRSLPWHSGLDAGDQRLIEQGEVDPPSNAADFREAAIQHSMWKQRGRRFDKAVAAGAEPDCCGFTTRPIDEITLDEATARAARNKELAARSVQTAALARKPKAG